MNTQELIDALNEQWEKKIDNIKAEIKEVINVNKVIGSNNSKAQNIGLMWVLEVIDKCIEVGEEKTNVSDN